MKKSLLLRGSTVLLSHAIVYVGKGQRTNEWGDGRYINAAVESADCILRRALWEVEKDLREI